MTSLRANDDNAPLFDGVLDAGRPTRLVMRRKGGHRVQAIRNHGSGVEAGTFGWLDVPVIYWDTGASSDVHALTQSQEVYFQRVLQPGFRTWLTENRNSQYQIILVLIFVITDLSLHAVGQIVRSPSVNPCSVVVVTNFCSLIIALSISFAKEGKAAIPRVKNPRTFGRFFLIACMFCISTICTKKAFYLGSTGEAIDTIGFIYMPVAALASVFILQRKYGILEALSLGILSLSVATFIGVKSVGFHPYSQKLELSGAGGVALISIAAILSAVASVLAERIYKNLSSSNENFYIYKVHVDATCLLVSLPIWAVTFIWDGPWFGPWGLQEAIVIVFTVLNGWMSGIFTKEFSTVFRCIVDTFVTFCVGVFSENLGRKDRDSASTISCCLLLSVVGLSALIFQRGRINIAYHERDVTVTETSRCGMLCEILRMICATLHDLMHNLCCDAKQYALLLVYVISDPARTLSLQQAQSKSMITPQWMVLLCFAISLVVANILTLVAEDPTRSRRERFRLAYFDYALVTRYFPCAFFLALSSTLLSSAFAHGISSSLSTTIGYVHTPLAAVGASITFGKYFLTLEWLALGMIFLTTTNFSFLQHHFTGGSDSLIPSFPMMLVVGSACSSVIGSLVCENALKGENVPFYIQKVRLDLGSVVASLILLVLIGGISARPQDAVWKQRPLSKTCEDDCWKNHNPANWTDSGACDIPDCSCECGSGIFVALDNYLVLLALFFNVLRGWLRGAISKKHSTEVGAIAEAFTILAIYFIGDPLVNPSASFRNVPMTCVALIVPLSVCVFIVAVPETKRAIYVPEHQERDQETEAGPPAEVFHSLDSLPVVSWASR